ncbi:MAG: hypothetical protein MRK02_10805 [Candidatus Scalindua sp.]|nr:hypothetical protein [Candidatus Scalindua sp.]
MKSMDDFQEFNILRLAHAINEDVRNGEFGHAHERINESIEQWKEKVNYELLCDEAQIMVELILCNIVFSNCLIR